MTNLKDGVAKDMSGLKEGVVKEMSGLKEGVVKEMSGLKEGVVKDMSGLKEGVVKDMSGLKELVAKEVDAKIAGVSDKAKAEALMVLKDYGVSTSLLRRKYFVLVPRLPSKGDLPHMFVLHSPCQVAVSGGKASIPGKA
jgi:hypothetical protein